MSKPEKKIGRPKNTGDKETMIITCRVLKIHVEAADRKAAAVGQNRSDRIQMYFESDYLDEF